MPIVRPNPPQGVTAVAPLQQSQRGGSGSFLVLANDSNRYWCKVINNGQGDRVPVTEQIVGLLGVLIGAPVCEPRLVYIPNALAGWEFRPGMPLVEGWAHGSLAAEPVVETNTLDHRFMDDNASRHAGIYALFDWTAGAEPGMSSGGGSLALPRERFAMAGAWVAVAGAGLLWAVLEVVGREAPLSAGTCFDSRHAPFCRTMQRKPR